MFPTQTSRASSPNIYSYFNVNSYVISQLNPHARDFCPHFFCSTSCNTSHTLSLSRNLTAEVFVLSVLVFAVSHRLRALSRNRCKPHCIDFCPRFFCSSRCNTSHSFWLSRNLTVEVFALSILVFPVPHAFKCFPAQSMQISRKRFFPRYAVSTSSRRDCCLAQPSLTDDAFRLSIFIYQTNWRFYALRRVVEHPAYGVCSLSGNVTGEIVA